MPEKQSLPSCADFIVATIRATRLNHKGLKAGTASGKAVFLVWSLVRQFYSEQDFRRSLATLIQNGTLMLVARVCRTDDGRYHVEKLSEISSKWPLESNESLYFGADGMPLAWEEVRQGASVTLAIQDPRLYVVADGLPGTVAHKGVQAKAESILASLQKK